jgi:hypothetical protein
LKIQEKRMQRFLKKNAMSQVNSFKRVNPPKNKKILGKLMGTVWKVGTKLVGANVADHEKLENFLSSPFLSHGYALPAAPLVSMRLSPVCRLADAGDGVVELPSLAAASSFFLAVNHQVK